MYMAMPIPNPQLEMVSHNNLHKLGKFEPPPRSSAEIATFAEVVSLNAAISAVEKVDRTSWMG